MLEFVIVRDDLGNDNNNGEGEKICTFHPLAIDRTLFKFTYNISLE